MEFESPGVDEGDAELEGRIRDLSAADKQRTTNPAEYSSRAPVRGNLRQNI